MLYVDCGMKYVNAVMFQQIKNKADVLFVH